MSLLQLTAVEFEELLHKKQPQGRIDWTTVYHKEEVVSKKFDRLPTPLPWTNDFRLNVEDTLEWLFRSGTGEATRYYPESIFNEATGWWYRSELLPGQFFHVCYPKEMLGYRGRYDGLFEAIQEKDDLRGALERITNSRAVLWSAWRCIGQDGGKRKPQVGDVVDIESEKITIENDAHKIAHKYWPQHWAFKCSRCGEDLPKSIRLSIFLELKLSKALA